MENQHRLVKGYRDLTEEEIRLMNKVKEMGVLLGHMIDDLQSIGTLDQRWVSEARTDLQKGIMSAVRAIARPTTF